MKMLLPVESADQLRSAAEGTRSTTRPPMTVKSDGAVALMSLPTQYDITSVLAAKCICASHVGESDARFTAFAP